MKLEKRLQPVIEKFNERFYNPSLNQKYTPYRKNCFWIELIDFEKQKRIYVYLIKQTDELLHFGNSYFLLNSDSDTYWLSDKMRTEFPIENLVLSVRCKTENIHDVKLSHNLKYINVQHEKELLELIDEL